jgi:hypothetical protein
MRPASCPPRFIEASTGTKVTMYAQWRTIEDYQAIRNNPASRDFLQVALAIAKFEPGIYEIVESYLPDDKGTRNEIHPTVYPPVRD